MSGPSVKESDAMTRGQFDPVSHCLYQRPILWYWRRRIVLPFVKVIRRCFPSFYALPPGIDGNRSRAADALNILILSDFHANPIGTVSDHVAAFANYSKNRVCFVDSKTCPHFNIDLSIFDCVICHYSMVISSTNHLADSFAEKLSSISRIQSAVYPGRISVCRSHSRSHGKARHRHHLLRDQ